MDTTDHCNIYCYHNDMVSGDNTWSYNITNIKVSYINLTLLLYKEHDLKDTISDTNIAAKSGRFNQHLDRPF